jgi:hypothetical protein
MESGFQAKFLVLKLLVSSFTEEEVLEPKCKEWVWVCQVKRLGALQGGK